MERLLVFSNMVCPSEYYGQFGRNWIIKVLDYRGTSICS